MKAIWDQYFWVVCVFVPSNREDSIVICAESVMLGFCSKPYFLVK